MDYTTLQTRVLNRLNITSSDPIGGLVDEYVNEAVHMIEVASPNGWPWMRSYVNWTTTAGTGSYTFSQVSSTLNVSKILDAKILRQSNYYEPLALISPEEADQNYPSTVTGIPEGFYVEGSTIYIYPTPDTAYSVKTRVVATDNDLVTTTASPTLPAVYHAAIVEGALTLMYETLQDSTRLQLAQARFAYWLDQMQKSGPQYQGVPRVRVREWL